MIIFERTWGNSSAAWEHTWTVFHLHACFQVAENVTITALSWFMCVTEIDAAGFVSLALDQNCSPSVADHVALHSANLLLALFAFFNKLGS